MCLNTANHSVQRHRTIISMFILIIMMISTTLVVTASAPSAPQNPDFRRIGSAYVTVEWTAPSSTGGSAITDYVIQSCNSAGTSCVTFNDGVSTNLYAKVTGLTNGTTYRFKVAAKNSTGTSAYSALTSAIAPRPPLQNGSFEVDAVDSTTITGWDLVSDNLGTIRTPPSGDDPAGVDGSNYIDLGVTSLGGCVSQDTTDYAGIWTRDTSKYGAPAAKPTFGTSPLAAYPANWPSNDQDEFATTTPYTVGALSVGQGWLNNRGGTDSQYGNGSGVANTYSSVAKTVSTVGSVGPSDGTKSLMLQLGNFWRDKKYHVLHGPAVVSDMFSASAGQVITLDWYSAAGADDFAVLGYLLDTATCTQYEVVDQSGTFTKSDNGSGSYVNAWQNSTVTVPATKSTYRFVFINGTFDRTGGAWSGASFWLDKIAVANPQEIPFGPVPDKYVGDGTFTVPEFADSGLTVSYTSSTTSVCTVTGKTVTLLSAGTCTLVARQSGGELNDETYIAATPVTQSFNVIAGSRPTATLTNSPVPTATNTATATPTFTPTPHPFAIKDVAVGASFTLAVLNNGTMATWGFNREGQASLPRWMRTKLVDQVEVGSNYAVVLGTDGRVYGWGANDFGQMRIPTAATSGVREISASLGHIMAIKTNGDLVIWGRNDFKQREAPLAALKGLTTVGAGHSHSLAVKNGRVIAWGRNTWGQTNVPSTLTNVIAVAGGFDHSMALRSNGTIVCWGRNHEGQCRIPAGLKDVVKISAGVSYSMALTRDGKLFAWGRNDYGQAKVPTDLSPVGAMSAGYVNSVVGMRDANVRAFGNAMHGSLVSRTPTVVP